MNRVKKGILNRYRRYLLLRLYRGEKGVISRQRITVFTYASVLLVAGVVLNLFGIAGPTTLFFKLSNLTQAGFAILGFWFYYTRRVKLGTAMTALCIVMQLEISAEMIYSALYEHPYDMALIIANMALSAVVLLIGIITYMRVVPYIVAGLSLTTYALCTYVTGSEELGSYFFVFCMIFIFFSILGSVMILNISRLDKENSILKNESQEVLDVFHLTKKEMHSYMMLAREKNLESDQTAQILNSVGSTAEKRILDNVAHFIRQSSIEYDKMKERLPELSPSELEICTLILKEKKQKEIIELLGKSRGNITSQRANIRAKLQMQPEENLYEVLKKRMES